MMPCGWIRTALAHLVAFSILFSASAQDGGYIAFLSTRDGNNHVYMMDPDGRNVRRLTDAADRLQLHIRYGRSGIAWSPDGRYVAFTADAGHITLSQLYVVDVRNGSIRKVLDGEQFNRATTQVSPAWSRDGKWIAVEGGGLGDGIQGIFAISPDGTVRRLTKPSQYLDMEPTWSPDGRRIAYTTMENWAANNFFDIFVTEIGGDARVDLTGHEQTAENPAWSPDGRSILYARSWTGQLVRLDLDSMEPHQLTDDPVEYRCPEWSPDGRSIVVQAGSQTPGEIVVMTVDGDNPTNLTNHPASDRTPSWVDPSLSVSPSSRLVLSVWSLLKRGSGREQTPSP